MLNDIVMNRLLGGGSDIDNETLVDARTDKDGATYDTLGDSIRGQIEKYHSAVASDTEPEHANVWINTENNNDENNGIDIPEINDDIISTEDTWSSSKINSVIDELKNSSNGSGGNESSNSELIKKCEERLFALEVAPATWCGECEEVDDSGRMLVNYAWKWSSSGQTLTFDKRAVTFGDTLEILISNNLTITNNKFFISDSCGQEECTIVSNENDIIFPLEVKSGDVLTLKCTAEQSAWFTFSKGLFTGVEKTVEELTNKIGNLTFTVDGTILNITDGTNNWSIPAN